MTRTENYIIEFDDTLAAKFLACGYLLSSLSTSEPHTFGCDFRLSGSGVALCAHSTDKLIDMI